jgi:hypothetical protein
VPGIITDGSISGIEGNGFAAANVSEPGTNGTAYITGGLDVNTGYVIQQSGVVLTFSGDFGWRYGTATTASDLFIHDGQSGFLIGSTVPVKDGVLSFNYGEQAASTLNPVTFSYTTTAADIGQTVSLRIRHAEANHVANLTQLLSDNWVVTAGVPDPDPVPTNATLVVGVRADGLAYYYNPFNGTSAYVNNGAIVEDYGPAGDVIGALGYGDSFYSFGQVTGSTNTAALGEYRVNRMSLAGVYHTVSENIGNQGYTRNILTNSADAVLVDFAYDGTNFWFLADDGAVFQNSSTNAAFSFSNTVAGVYHSLSVQQSKLVAGVTRPDGLSRVVVYNSGALSLRWSQGGGAVTGGVTRVAGNADSSLLFVSRADGYVYEVSAGGGGDYFGSGVLWGGTPVDTALGLIDQTNSVLHINDASQIYYRDAAKSNAVSLLSTLSGSGFVGLAVVEVAVMDSGYGQWSLDNGLTGGAEDDDDDDGLLNVYEYGLGGDPMDPDDQGTLPVMSVSNGGASYTHVLLTDSTADISYIVEQTSDLVGEPWTNADWSAVTTNTTTDAAFDAVEYQTADGDRLFLRLRITQP